VPQKETARAEKDCKLEISNFKGRETPRFLVAPRLRSGPAGRLRYGRGILSGKAGIFDRFAQNDRGKTSQREVPGLGRRAQARVIAPGKETARAKWDFTSEISNFKGREGPRRLPARLGSAVPEGRNPRSLRSGQARDEVLPPGAPERIQTDSAQCRGPSHPVSERVGHPHTRLSSSAASHRRVPERATPPLRPESRGGNPSRTCRGG